MWDTIVIGAGLGGLTAAAGLVNSGKRVLVLDRKAHPGGTAYSYTRGQFVFPMGPLGFSNPGIVNNIFADLTAGNDLKCHRVHYRIKAFGLGVPISLPFDDLTAELSKLFPRESTGIRHFFQDVARSSVVEPDAIKTVTSKLKALPDTPASAHLKNVKDWRLRRILGSIGTSEPYTCFALLSAMWKLMCREGIWYPEGGLRGICDCLVSVIDSGNVSHQANGMVKLQTEVKRVRVDRGKVAGVVLSDGSVLDSKSVISNADYKTTFLNLFDARDVPAKLLADVRRAGQAGSILQVCLGVNRSTVDLSVFADADRIIYRGDGMDGQEEPIDWNSPRFRPELVAGQELELGLLSCQDPGLSPPDGAVIVIRTAAPYSHFASFRLERGRRIPAYGEYKEQLAVALLEEVSRIIPGLDKAILTMDAATPLTFFDEGGRSQGAVAGWSWEYAGSCDRVLRDLILTPVEGMYMAGLQAFSMLSLGGVATAMESGRRASQAVLNRAGPVEDMAIPVSRG